MQRALFGMSTIKAVKVHRSSTDQGVGGFRWFITFIALSSQILRSDPVSIIVNGSTLTGENAMVTTWLETPRVGEPAAIYQLATTATPQPSVHAVTLRRGGPAFLRLGLDTRNISMRVGSASFGSEGSLKWTAPIPISAVGNQADERAGYTLDNRGRVVPAYPPHSTGSSPGSSIESYLRRLPNWIDLGSAASLRVARHERESHRSVTWRLTFVNAPHKLPLLHAFAVPGGGEFNEAQVKEASILDGEYHATSQYTESSSTRKPYYSERRAAKERIDPTGFASAILEVEALPLRGSFRVGFAGEKWSENIPVGAAPSALCKALKTIDVHSRLHSDRAARLVVSRDGPNVAGGYDYWIAFVRRPFNRYRLNLRTDATLLDGPNSRGASASLHMAANEVGRLRIDYGNKSLAWLEGKYDGDNHIVFSGKSHALSDALSTLAFQPAADYFGSVGIDVAVTGPTGDSSSVGFDLEVKPRNDAPDFTWKGIPIQETDVGYHDAFVAELDEDTEARITWMQVKDVDTKARETLVATIAPEYGTVSCLCADDTNTTKVRSFQRLRSSQDSVNGSLVLRGSLTEINHMLQTLIYAGKPDWNGFDTLRLAVADSSGGNSRAEVLVRVNPVNDIPAWTIDSTNFLYQPSESTSLPPRAGRGLRRLVSDQLSYENNTSSFWMQRDDVAENRSKIVSTRFLVEDGGATILGGIDVDDPDIPRSVELRRLQSFSDECPWPAHLEINASVKHGKLSLRHGTAVGAAGILAASRSSGNLQMIADEERNMRFCGQIESVRDALATLAYSPDANWNGVDVLDLLATDGGDAEQGGGGARTSSVHIAIYVSSQPDAPFVVLPTSSGPALEDEPFVFGVVDDAVTRCSVQPFQITDADFIDRTTIPRRWLVPHTAGDATPRYSSDAELGVFSRAPNHPHSSWRQWVGPEGFETSVGSGDADVFDVYNVNISARHGRIYLPHALETEASDSPRKFQTLKNYSLAALNSAIFGLVYVSEKDWNSEAQAKKIADVRFSGRIYEPEANVLEIITLHVVDGTGQESITRFELMVLAVNDPPLLSAVPISSEDADESNAQYQLKEKIPLRVQEDSLTNPLGFAVDDVDAADTINGMIDITAIASHGSLFFDRLLDSKSRKALVITAGAEGTHTLCFAATLKEVQAAIATLSYQPDPNFSGLDTVFLSAADRGNSGIGGELSDFLSLPILVEPECDSPTAKAVPTSATQTDEDSAIALSFDIFDVDHGSIDSIAEAPTSEATHMPKVRVSLDAGNGTLTMEAREGLEFEEGFTGIAEASMSFQAALVYAKEAVKSLVYAPRRDFYTFPIRPAIRPYDVVRVVVDDLGLDGGGGNNSSLCAPLSASATVSIRIDAVNDPPKMIFAGARSGTNSEGESLDDKNVELAQAGTQYVAEDTDLIIGDLVTFTDDSTDANAFSDALGALSIVVTGGEFSIESVNGGYIRDLDVHLGPVEVAHSEGEAIAASDSSPRNAIGKWRRKALRWLLRPLEAQEMLKSLRFRSLPSAWGNATLTIAYEDGGYGGSGGVALGVSGCIFCVPSYQLQDRSSKLHESFWDAVTIPIVIYPVPDAPYFKSSYALGASVSVREDASAWLDDVVVVDPDDPEAIMSLRVSVERGSVSLREPPPEALIFVLGDGETDQNIEASGPLSAINNALTGLRYTPPGDFTYLNSRGKLDFVNLVIDDDNPLTQSGSMTIRLLVEPASNDAPVLHVPNSTRVQAPCSETFEYDWNSRQGNTDCKKSIAEATMSGFAEDVTSFAAFADIFVLDVDESENEISYFTLAVAVGRGFLSIPNTLSIEFVVGDGGRNALMRNFTIRAMPSTVNMVFDVLEYTGNANWHGADLMDIIVTDSSGETDSASIVLLVDSVKDLPFMEMRVENPSSAVFRSGNGILDEESRPHTWEHAARAASTVYSLLEAFEDRKIRIPSLRVRDPDAEANEYSPGAAGLGGSLAGVAIENSLYGHVVEVSSRLRLSVSCKFGTIQLCAVGCPAIGFTQKGETTSPIQERWWASADLEGTAAALTSALWDWHYWPALNYNSDAYNSPDDIIRVKLYSIVSKYDETQLEIADELALRVAVRAMNDAPVVKVARLETLARGVKSQRVAPMTGDGLSPKVSAIDDSVLVTDEDTPLKLHDLFTVRDVDADESAIAGGNGGSIEIEVVSTYGFVRLPPPRELGDIIFLVPETWTNSTFSRRGENEAPLVRFVAKTIAVANDIISGLVFIPKQDWHGDTASVRVTCSDRGNSGIGGVRTGSQRVIIRVRPSNDIPTLAAPRYDTVAAQFVDQGESIRLIGTRFEDAVRLHVGMHAPSGDGDDVVIPYTHSNAEIHEDYQLWRSIVLRPRADAAKVFETNDSWRQALVTASHHPRYFAEYEGDLYFAASRTAHGHELMKTDGKTVTLVADILPGMASSSPKFLTRYGGRLYFGASGINDKAWRLPVEHTDDCDGFRESTFNAGVHFAVSEANEWVPGHVYDCPRGYNWITTAEAESLFTGQNRGASTGYQTFEHDASFEDMTYFGNCGWHGYDWGGRTREHFRFADSHITGAFKSAGSPDSRRPDFDRPSRKGFAFKTKHFAGIVCLSTDDEDDHHQQPTSELWVSKGSERSTFRASEVKDPRFLAVFDGALFFAGNDGVHGSEPFRFVANNVRGEGEARLLIDVRRGPFGSDPKFFTSCDDALWFSADDGLHGAELWVSDGSLGFLDRESGDAAHPSSFPEIGGAGTRMVFDVDFGPSGSAPSSLVCLENTLLFAASSGKSGRELWRARYNATSSKNPKVQILLDIHAGGGSSNPEYLTVYDGRTYFSADDGEHGVEMWSSDGTSTGTRLLKDVWPGTASSTPRFLTVASGQLYFIAQRSDHRSVSIGSTLAPDPAQLWSTDGSVTRRVYDQTESMFDVDRSGLDAAWPPRLGVLDGVLFYPARRGGSQLFGGVSRGKTHERTKQKLAHQAFAIFDVDEDEILTLSLWVEPTNAGELSVTRNLQGPVFHLNQAMRDVIFRASSDFYGVACVRARIVDNSTQAASAFTEIFVRQVNDPPNVERPGSVSYMVPLGKSSITINEGVVFKDPDVAETTFGTDPRTGESVWPRMTAKITVSHGRISLNYVEPRPSFAEGDGVVDRAVVFDASLGDLNEAVRQLRYECKVRDGCIRPLNDTVIFTISDNGFSGAGGPKEASTTLQVRVL